MKIGNKLKVAVAALSVVACGAMTAMPAFATTDATTDATTGTGTGTGTSSITGPKQYIGSSSEQTATGKSSDANTLTSTVNTVINIAIGIIGLLAVIMIIVGGFQYTTSAGDSGKVTKAKNTIMYGVIGLVIALLAYAIVNFVLGKVF